MLSFFRRRWFHWDDPTPPLLSTGIKKAECLFFFIIGLLSARPDGGSEKGTGKERHEGMIEAGPDGRGLPICFTVFNYGPSVSKHSRFEITQQTASPALHPFPSS